MIDGIGIPGNGTGGRGCVSEKQSCEHLFGVGGCSGFSRYDSSADIDISIDRRWKFDDVLK